MADKPKLSLKPGTGRRRVVLKGDTLPVDTGEAAYIAPASDIEANASKPKKQPPKKRKRPPSELRVNALDSELSKLSKVWRSHQPLSLGIQDQVFQFISAGHLSASKRAVKALLRKHCTNPNYLRNTVEGEPRRNLIGDTTGQVLPDQASHANRQLAAIEAAKADKVAAGKKRKEHKPKLA